MSHIFSINTYIRITLFASTLYLAVLLKEMPVTHAQVALLNCDADLDQADTVYELQNNIAGNCTVTANNITIDGLDQYSITGNIVANGINAGDDGFDVTLQNITEISAVQASGGFGGGEGGTINIINSSTLTVSAYGKGDGYAGGTVNITDSSILGNVRAAGGGSHSGDGGMGGTINIINSSISGRLEASGGESYSGTAGVGGSVEATDSTIGDRIMIQGGGASTGYSGVNEEFTPASAAGFVTLIRSTVVGDIYAHSSATSVGLVIEGNVFGGTVTIEDSSATGDIETYGGLEDGSLDGSLAIIDNAPIITAPADITLTPDEVFTLEDPLADITAEDIKDGDLTEDIEFISGEVLTDPGEYKLIYEVSDSGTSVTFNGDVVTSDPATNTTTFERTITRLADDTPPSTPRRRSSGGSSRPTPPPALPPTTTLPTTVEGLTALLTQLQQQLATLLANTPASDNNPILNNTNPLFTRDLRADMEGEDVLQLQILLNSKGYTINTPPLPGAPGYESTYFGNKTQDALIKYQKDNNITPATGYFGVITRGRMTQ